MARTKRQVLLNAAKKQRRHGLLREAAGVADALPLLDVVHHAEHEISDQNKKTLQTGPVQNKVENVKKDLQKSFQNEHKQNVSIHESPKHSVQKDKIETVTSSSSYSGEKLSKRRQLNTTYSPSLGSIRQLKLTARKSTHCEKKAEAEQILAALMNSPKKSSNSPSSDVCPWNFSSKGVSDNSPVSPISTSTPVKHTARKSLSGSVFTTKQRARKSFSPCFSNVRQQAADESSDSVDSESFNLKVFPSVHEAVLTLPKCEQLPVALVCINDVLRNTDSPPVESFIDSPSRKPSPMSDKPSPMSDKPSTSPQATSTPKPALKIKSKRLDKNIFDQFESEIKQSPKYSKSRPIVEGTKSGKNDDKHSPTKPICVLKKSPGKTDGKETHTRSGSPRSRSSGSPKGDSCVVDEKEKKSLSNSLSVLTNNKDSKSEKIVRNRSSSPRCDISSLISGDKSPRRRSPRRTGLDREITSVSCQQSCETESLQSEIKCSELSDSKTTVSPKLIQSPSARLSPDTSAICKNIDCNSEDCGVHSDKGRKKVSPSSHKRTSSDNVSDNEDNEKTMNLKTRSCKSVKEIQDGDNEKGSVNDSSNSVKMGSNLLDLISRVGNRLQDPSSLDFLNESPESLDDSSSISLATNDPLESLEDTSMEIDTSSEEQASSALTDAVSSTSDSPGFDKLDSKNNALSGEQNIRKSPRKKFTQDEYNKAYCDKASTNATKTEASTLKDCDDTASCVQSSKSVHDHENSALIKDDCVQHGSKPSHVEPLNENDIAYSKNLSELSNKERNAQVDDSHKSFESVFQAFASTTEEAKLSAISSPKISPKNVQKPRSHHKEPIAVKTETKKAQNMNGSLKKSEPSSLEVLCKPEKSNADKRSAFISDDLDSFLVKAKHDSIKPDQTIIKKELIHVSEHQDIKDNNLGVFEPDFDEIEGVLFLSFPSEDALKAHIAVEKKNHWDKDCNYFWGISKLKAFEQEKKENKSSEKTPTLRNLRGKHMKWKKYRSMLRRELSSILRRNRLQAPYFTKQPNKTSDITKIKGWKKRGSRNHFRGNMGLNVYASGKIHWRTEARLIRNMKADDIKALGIEVKKKRRKNVIFTNRKRSSKEFENSCNKTDDFQEVSDGDLFEIEDTVLSSGHSSRGSDCEYIYESDHALEDASEFKRLGVVKSTCIRKEFVTQFNWDERDEQIQKKLGGRVRNRQKKNDPRDMTGILAKYGETIVPPSDEVPEIPRKKKRQKFIPFIVLSKVMVKEAVKALFGEAVEQSQPKNTRATVSKNKNTSDSKHETRTRSNSFDDLEPGEILDPYDDRWQSKSRDHSRDECDKPGCRYGCICHLCNSAEELEESDVQQMNQSRPCDKEYCRLGCICDSLNNQKVDHFKSRCSKPECFNVCHCKPKPTLLSQHSTGEATIISDEDEPPRLDSMDKKMDDASEIKKQGKKKKADLDPEYMPEVECSEKRASVGEESKKKTRLPRGDRFVNLPRRESMHRTSKNLDAVTRKAMMLYEMSEIYWEVGERKRRTRDDSTNKSPDTKSSTKSAAQTPGHTAVAYTSKDNVADTDHLPSSTITAEESNTISPKNKTKRKTRDNRIAESPDVKPSKDGADETLNNPSSTTKSDEEHLLESNTTSTSSKSKTKSPLNQSKTSKQCKPKPCVEPILISGDDSDVDDVTVCSAPTSGSNSQTESVDMDQMPENVLQKMERLTEDLKQKRHEVTVKNALHHHPLLQNSLYSNLSVTSWKREGIDRKVFHWHTQMVCLKANPKPKLEEESLDNDIQEEDEIKLLEFIANCNWDNAKSLILSRVAQCLNRGIYPPPKKMIVNDYSVEILPKADKPACIPPELREKLPDTMFSIRVKVTKKSDPVDLSQMKAFEGNNTSLVKQQLQKSKNILPKMSCDSASNRVFNKMNCVPKEFSVTLKLTNSRKPVLQIPVKSTGKPSNFTQKSSPGSNQKTSLLMTQKDAKDNNYGISGFCKLKISHPSASKDVKSEGRMVRPDKEKCSPTRRKKQKVSADVDNLGPIVIENAETGVMKPLLPSYSDATKEKVIRPRTNNRRRKPKSVNLESVESIDSLEPDSDVIPLDDKGNVVIKTECKDSDYHTKSARSSKPLKTGAAKTFLSYSIENGSLIEKKCLPQNSSSPTTTVAETADQQSINVSPVTSSAACDTTTQSNSVQSGKQPILLPAPLKGGQLIGPFSNLSDLKFLQIPGNKDPTASASFLQLVPSTGGNTSVQKPPSTDYIAIPVTFKGAASDKLSHVNKKKSNSADKSISDNIKMEVEQDSNLENSIVVPQDESLCSEQTPNNSQAQPKKRRTRKKKIQQILIEGTNQIVFVNACIPQEEKVKRKRPVVQVAKEVLDGYAASIACVAAVGLNNDANTSINTADKTYVDLDESKVASQSALAALLLTDTTKSITSKTENTEQCSVKSRVSGLTKDNLPLVQSSSDVEELSNSKECQKAGNSCKMDLSKNSSGTPSDEQSSVSMLSKDNCGNAVSLTSVDSAAVVSSSSTLLESPVREVKNQKSIESVQGFTETASQNTEKILGMVCDVENVDPKVKRSVPSPEKVSSVSISEMQSSELGVKRKLPVSDVDDCAVVAKKVKKKINSSSHKLYDLIVNKVAGFPFPEDSESENSMSVGSESLDDCCERISLQISCDDGITEAVSTIGQPGTQSLLQNRNSDCNSPIQGKLLSSKTQIKRKLQTADLPNSKFNKELTESTHCIALREDALKQSLLKPKCSPELAKMLLGDINQNFDRKQKILNQSGSNSSSEQIQSSSDNSGSCSIQNKTCCTNKSDLSKVPAVTGNSTSNSVVKSAQMEDGSTHSEDDPCNISSSKLSSVKPASNHCPTATHLNKSMQDSQSKHVSLCHSSADDNLDKLDLHFEGCGDVSIKHCVDDCDTSLKQPTEVSHQYHKSQLANCKQESANSSTQRHYLHNKQMNNDSEKTSTKTSYSLMADNGTSARRDSTKLPVGDILISQLPPSVCESFPSRAALSSSDSESNCLVIDSDCLTADGGD